MDMTGRKVLLSGGAGHIGVTVIEALVELGATVAVIDTNLEEINDRLEQGDDRRHKVIGFPADLSSETETRQTVRKAADEMDGIDVLIHAAAYVGSNNMSGWAEPFAQQTVAAWNQGLQVNLTSAFVLAQEARPYLEVSGRGNIIFFGSIYGIIGPDLRLYNRTNMANPVAYGVSKAALNQLCRYLAMIFAPKIRVNTISPGGIWRSQPAAFVDKYISKTPLGRMATEEDIKGAVVYLASDLSAYVTGQNVIVDGGWTTW